MRGTALNAATAASGGPSGGQQLKAGTMNSKSSSQAAQSVPKRAPHSELTSYQSEKRLKEYKQQQAQLAQQ